MEQKTEASQAVDEREQFEQWAKRRGHDIVSRLETGGKFYNSSFTTHLWATWQACAALKAQPAPTEAAQGAQPSGNPGELVQGWDVDDLINDMDINEEVAGMRAELQANSTIIPSILAAQGEDSARLDAERYQWIRVPANHFRIATSARWNTADQLDAIIDRARASSETGGVKP